MVEYKNIKAIELEMAQELDKLSKEHIKTLKKLQAQIDETSRYLKGVIEGLNRDNVETNTFECKVCKGKGYVWVQNGSDDVDKDICDDCEGTGYVL